MAGVSPADVVLLAGCTAEGDRVVEAGSAAESVAASRSYGWATGGRLAFSQAHGGNTQMYLVEAYGYEPPDSHPRPSGNSSVR